MTDHITPDPNDERQKKVVVTAVIEGTGWHVDTGVAARILAALRDLPPEPPLPPEPTEPGTVVWDRDGVAWIRGFDSWFGYVGPRSHSLDWTHLFVGHGPLTTRQPGTIPAEAVADDRVAEWDGVLDNAYRDAATEGQPHAAARMTAMRTVLARIRDWQST